MLLKVLPNLPLEILIHSRTGVRCFFWSRSTNFKNYNHMQTLSRRFTQYDLVVLVSGHVMSWKMPTNYNFTSQLRSHFPVHRKVSYNLNKIDTVFDGKLLKERMKHLLLKIFRRFSSCYQESVLLPITQFPISSKILLLTKVSTCFTRVFTNYYSITLADDNKRLLQNSYCHASKIIENPN